MAAWAPAAIAAGGAIISGLIGSRSAGQAAGAVEDAAKISAEAAKELYYQGREDLQPYASGGEYALNALIGTPGTPAATTPAKGTTDQRAINVLQKIKDARIQAGDFEGAQKVQASIDRLVSLSPQTTEGTPGTPGILAQYPEGEPMPQWKPPVINVKTSPEDYEESPYYNFLLDKTTQAAVRNAAARGYSMSPRLAMELQRNAAGLASADYSSWLDRQYREKNETLGDWYNRRGFEQAQWGTGRAAETGDWMNRYNALMGMARMGQASAAGQAAGGQNLANTLSNLNLASGAAQGQGYLNQASALTQGLSSGINNLLYYNALNQNQPVTQPSNLPINNLYGQQQGLDSRYLGYQGYGM
jgi:hypothetical protein